MKSTFKLNLLMSIITIMYSYDVIFSMVYAKNSNHTTFNIHQHINQLHQISNAHSECLIQIQQQLFENQKNINILRGHVQDIQHHISKINNNQKESFKKLNEMINNHNNTCINNDIHQSFITPISTTVPYTTTNTNTTLKKITHDHAYKQAVSLVLEKKQYDQAIYAFQNFIKNYPNSNYQANAHYWLGQLFYNKNKKDKASYYFALVTKKYPKSIKAPDALLKIGIIMQETHQKDKAKIIYRQIGKLYPNSSAAKQAQKHLARLL